MWYVIYVGCGTMEGVGCGIFRVGLKICRIWGVGYVGCGVWDM